MLKIFTSCFLLVCFTAANAQVTLQTSFETPQGYNVGNLNAQNGWALTSGTAVVSNVKAKTGTQSINLSAANGALLLNYVAYGGSVPGITGDVYADMWVNPVSFVTKGIAINGYDLFGGSAKRIFVIEFGTDNSIKAYNSSAPINIGTWTSNQWVRLSVKMNFTTATYKVAVNGLVNATDFAFRETYTPTSSGTRGTNKEFHSLRFNHTTDTQLATSDATIDDLYIGNDPIADVSFGAPVLVVTQPAFGSISLSATAPYTLNQTVTATLTLPQGYTNLGWTGSLSGTSLTNTFTITGNMAFSANVDIDINNPPPKYLITINQPANGAITLSPTSVDNMYYQGTPVTATATYEACYQFNNWTGDLSGTTTTKSFTIQNNMSIGAAITLNSIPATTRVVSSVAQFKTAVAAMNPGDTVIVEDGTYDLSSLSIARSACALRPAIIMARNTGGAILNGATALVFKNMQYVTLKGFAFRSTGVGTGIKLENCSRFRITQNNFALTETTSCTWINIGDTYGSTDPLRSGYNRIDHNTLDGKTQAGNYIRMDGNYNQQSQYDTIDHNHFKNNGPRAENEKESIRVGVSTLSKSSGFTMIEYNLFEDCDGDPEVVSIKSCDNTIRYNTFLRCLGTLCLRQGFRSTAEGNYFFGDGKTGTYNGGTIGCGGVRIYAKDHKVINNYFSGLTGSKWDAAITITNGDVTNASASLADHYLPENLTVAFNTFVNNQSNIEIGFNNSGSYPLSPVNCLITNNIVIDNTNPIIKSYSTTSLAGVAFSNNIMYPTGTSSIGITASAAQINVVDPKLVQPVCVAPTNCATTNAYKVMRLSANSPAIDAATGTYATVVMDNEKQVRTGAKDIGADEFTSGNPVTVNFTALDANLVGPNAIDQSYSYTLLGALAVDVLRFTAALQNNNATLQWQVGTEINVKGYAIEWSIDGSAYITIGNVSATGNTMYSFSHTAVSEGKNYYRLRIIDNNGQYKFSNVSVVDRTGSKNISLYPAPADGILNIKIASPATGIQLINAMGMKVKDIKQVSNGINKINIAALPAGIYIIQVINNNENIFSSKILIAH